MITFSAMGCDSVPWAVVCSSRASAVCSDCTSTFVVLAIRRERSYHIATWGKLNRFPKCPAGNTDHRPILADFADFKRQVVDMQIRCFARQTDAQAP
jgi:hypothetical protein